MYSYLKFPMQKNVPQAYATHIIYLFEYHSH